MTTIVLASGSKRRIELLKDAGINCIICPANIVETILPNEKPDALVKRLAWEKANKIALLHPDNIVLGADTIVYLNGEIIGKPGDLDQARAFLCKLNDNTHSVFTGVSLQHLSGKRDVVWTSRTEVTFNRLTDTTIDHLIQTTNPLDKAGGYAIQEHEELLISGFNGLRSNIIGLPIEEVLERLKLME